MSRFIKLGLALAGASVLAMGSAGAWAKNDPGVTDKQVLVCAYQPMTGKESTYFRMGKGADAWFKYVNAQGGVNGRKIKFKMVDDAYNPSRTKVIVKQFIERDKCFALVSPLGSAPTAAVIDYIVKKKMPLIGAGTGAKKNVSYPSKYVFPLYPSYGMEGRQIVRFGDEKFGAKKVALLYQNDPSGKTHLAAIKDETAKRGMKLVAAEPYEKDELDVSAQTIKMKNSGADMVICSCAPEHAAKFYTERKKLGWKVPVVNVFFGKSPKVPELAGNDAVKGVYFTTIFRDVASPNPNIRLAIKILKKYYPQETPDAIHLWGFAGAQVFTEALRRMGRDNITRDRLVATLEGIKGWKGSVVPVVNIGHGNAPQHFLISQVAWTQYDGKRFKEINPPWFK